MNRLARKIGVVIVSVAIATSQSIAFSDFFKEESVDAEKIYKEFSEELTEVSTSKSTGSAIVIKLDISNMVEDDFDILEDCTNEENPSDISLDEKLESENTKTESNIKEMEEPIEVDEIVEVEEKAKITEVIETEETKSNDDTKIESDLSEGESIVVDKLTEESLMETDESLMETDESLMETDESLIESDKSEIVSDDSVIDNIENEVTTGASTMISIDKNILKSTGAACEIETSKVIEEPFQVESIQYVERVEKIEIQNLSDILNVNMSYTTVDYKRLDIKVSYDVILDVEADQIEIEDSFFGKTILNKVDGIYTGEASKVVCFEDVMQSLIVKGFYNTKVLEAIMPNQMENLSDNSTIAIESLTIDTKSVSSDIENTNNDDESTALDSENTGLSIENLEEVNIEEVLDDSLGI